MTTENRAQEQARLQYESIEQMVAALDADNNLHGVASLASVRRHELGSREVRCDMSNICGGPS